MAVSPVVPKEKLSAYQRWELGSFDEPPAPAADEAPSAEKIEEAHARARAEGYAAGHAAGLEAGRREALAEGAARIARMDQILGSLESDLERLDRELAVEVVQLGLAVARKLVGAGLEARPELVRASVEEALRHVGQSQAPVQVVVHPEDAAIVRTFLDAAPGGRVCALKDDPAVERGGCRVVTATGEIDATLPSRWERVTAALGEPSAWVA